MSTTKDTPCTRTGFESRAKAYAARNRNAKVAHKVARRCRRHGETETWHLVIPTSPKDRTRKA